MVEREVGQFGLVDQKILVEKTMEQKDNLLRKNNAQYTLNVRNY